MHQFYCSSHNISANKIIIEDKEQVHHIKDVLRLKLNDELKVFDEKGNEYICSIGEVLNKRIIARFKNKLLSKIQRVKITIACALPKKSKMDEIIDKLTQLGVDRIIPLRTQRVIIKLDKRKEGLRLSRWRKIAQNASQQCQRNTLPVIDTIKRMKEVLSGSENFDLKLIPTLVNTEKLFFNTNSHEFVSNKHELPQRCIHKNSCLKDIFATSKPNNVIILIGPEGDFSDEEVVLAIKAGCIPVSLGDLVLRVDTAAIAVVSFIRLLFQ